MTVDPQKLGRLRALAYASQALEITAEAVMCMTTLSEEEKTPILEELLKMAERLDKE